ncbi:hypothetical protein AB0M12_32820 [Nocardia vinacea]|uniref:hypothetical protein n=1 Tax=Nocardia vinacea TaxID=96468 RepID=UPI00342499EE
MSGSDSIDGEGSGGEISSVRAGRDIRIMWPVIASATGDVVVGSDRRLGRAHGRLRAELEDVLGTPPTSELDALVHLVAEADLRAFDWRRVGKRWGRAYFVLGLPAAILAGVSGAAGLAEEQFRIAAAVIALISAGLSAAATFLNSDDRAAAASMMSAAWQELADDSRMEVLNFRRAQPGGPDGIGAVLLQLHRRKGRLLRGNLADLDSHGDNSR